MLDIEPEPDRIAVCFEPEPSKVVWLESHSKLKDLYQQAMQEYYRNYGSASSIQKIAWSTVADFKVGDVLSKTKIRVRAEKASGSMIVTSVEPKHFMTGSDFFAPLSPEEVQKNLHLIEHHLKEKQLIEKQRDEALLRDFPRQSDLIAKKDERIVDIDGAIAQMRDRMKILKKRLSNIEDLRAGRWERMAGRSEALESERITVQRSIDSTDAELKSKVRKRRQIIAQFDRDLNRYRELKQQR